jgi:hypothetical protein
MKISNSLVSLLVLGTVAFGSALAGNAQQESPAPAAPKAPTVEMPSTPGTAPETPPVAPSTPSVAPSDTPSAAPGAEMPPKPGDTPPASGGGTPSVAPPSTEMPPKSGETSPASSGGGSLSEPTSSLSGGAASKVLAMCGSSSAPLLVESGDAPIGCRESRINAAPAAALK